MAQLVPDVLLVLHEDGDEFVADLWSRIRIVYQAELAHDRGLVVVAQLFGPAILVQALAVQYHERQDDSLPEAGVHSVTQPVQVERKYLVNFHLLAVDFRQIIVVAEPEIPGGVVVALLQDRQLLRTLVFQDLL